MTHAADAGGTGVPPDVGPADPGRLTAKHARNMPGGCFTARKHSGMAAETPPGEGDLGRVP